MLVVWDSQITNTLLICLENWGWNRNRLVIDLTNQDWTSSKRGQLYHLCLLVQSLANWFLIFICVDCNKKLSYSSRIFIFKPQGRTFLPQSKREEFAEQIYFLSSNPRATVQTLVTPKFLSYLSRLKNLQNSNLNLFLNVLLSSPAPKLFEKLEKWLAG